jgi:hypothetical protein
LRHNGADWPKKRRLEGGIIRAHKNISVTIRQIVERGDDD